MMRSVQIRTKWTLDPKIVTTLQCFAHLFVIAIALSWLPGCGMESDRDGMQDSRLATNDTQQALVFKQWTEPEWVSKAGIRLWPDGIVYYQFDESFDDANQKDLSKKKLFGHAITNWSKIANVSFVEIIDEKSTKNRVIIHSEEKSAWNSSCGSSLLGYHPDLSSGNQRLIIRCWSNQFAALHEIGHLLGRIDEQNRCNRNRYVAVIDDAIRDGKERTLERRMNYAAKTAYDYHSIMHYPATAKTKFPGIPTMVSLDLQSNNDDDLSCDNTNDSILPHIQSKIVKIKEYVGSINAGNVPVKIMDLVDDIGASSHGQLTNLDHLAMSELYGVNPKLFIPLKKLPHHERVLKIRAAEKFGVRCPKDPETLQALVDNNVTVTGCTSSDDLAAHYPH